VLAVPAGGRWKELLTPRRWTPHGTARSAPYQAPPVIAKLRPAAPTDTGPGPSYPVPPVTERPPLVLDQVDGHRLIKHGAFPVAGNPGIGRRQVHGVTL
jgi:hypothetical protein